MRSDLLNDPAISVRGLSKQYRLGQRERYTTLRDAVARRVRDPFGRKRDKDAGTFWALKDVSFEVKRGEAVGVIGRNGAGKSTLLKILSRITEPTEGEADLYGRVGSLLEVGTGFNPELTGRENIYLNGAILGMKRTEIARKFDEIVAFAETEQFIDTPVKHYSSGMYMRLAFAVAAHLEPEILIVDEVLAVGDAQFQRKCLGKMGEVALQGRTVLFVSHNMPAVTRLCSRGLLLDRGRLVADGTAEEVVGAYMRKSAASGTTQDWNGIDSPGTHELRLRQIGLYRPDGTACPQLVDVGDELHIRIGYVTATPGLRFRVGVNLTTQGVCAFSTMELREQVRTEPGYYWSRVVIPPHLLAEGEYSVNLSIFTSRGVKSHFVQKPDALTFQVVDSMDGTSARGDYAERWAGVVRPLLHWHLEYAGGRDPGSPADEPTEESET